MSKHKPKHPEAPPIPEAVMQQHALTQEHVEEYKSLGPKLAAKNIPWATVLALLAEYGPIALEIIRKFLNPA